MNTFPFFFVRVVVTFLFASLLAGCQSGINPNNLYQTESAPLETQTETKSIPVGSGTQTPLSEPKTNLLTPQFAFTRENPVTDNNQIILLLEELQTRYLSQFSKPGWYYFPFDGSDNYWVHLPMAGDNSFDQFLWTRQFNFYAPGFVFPASIILSDGSWGASQINSKADDYSIALGGRQLDHLAVLTELDYFASNPGGGVFGDSFLNNMINQVHTPEDGYNGTSTFSGWVEDYEGQQAFVLLTHTTYPMGKPQLSDSLAFIEEQDSYTYLALENGGRIAWKSIYYLENGSTQEDKLKFDQPQVEYFEELPKDTRAIFDQTSAKLRDFLAQINY